MCLIKKLVFTKLRSDFGLQIYGVSETKVQLSTVTRHFRSSLSMVNRFTTLTHINYNFQNFLPTEQVLSEPLDQTILNSHRWADAKLNQLKQLTKADQFSAFTDSLLQHSFTIEYSLLEKPFTVFTFATPVIKMNT